MQSVFSTARSDNLITVCCSNSSSAKPLNSVVFALLNTQSVSNKSFIPKTNIDFLFLTETWFKPGECFPLVEPWPPSYNVLNAPRLTGCGGGIATVF